MGVDAVTLLLRKITAKLVVIQRVWKLANVALKTMLMTRSQNDTNKTDDLIEM